MTAHIKDEHKFVQLYSLGGAHMYFSSNTAILAHIYIFIFSYLEEFLGTRLKPRYWVQMTIDMDEC